MPITYGTVRCDAFTSSSAGTVGIASAASSSVELMLPRGTYFDGDGPLIDGSPNEFTTVVMLHPVGQTTTTANLTNPAIAVPTYPLTTCPQTQWHTGYSYVVGDRVYSQTSAAAPFLGYICISNVTGAVSPDADATHWLLITGQQYGTPWSSTAGYTQSDWQWTFYRGVMYFPNGTVVPGSPPPAASSAVYDPFVVPSTIWCSYPETFTVQTYLGPASDNLTYSFQVINPTPIPYTT